MLVAAIAIALVYALFVAGSSRVARPGRGFLSAPRQYRFLEYRNVIVADERGTTEIDVVAIGNAGVFVVELKEYNAWIFGNENDDMWTASYPDRSKHHFQNPLRQNFRHIKALQSRLGLPRELFKSIIVFSGNTEFKTPMPSNVIVGGYRAYIEQADGIVLPDSEVRRVSQMLEALESASTGDALDAHVSDLKARYSSTTRCPKCGAALVERRARGAAPSDPGFLGCKSYPRCRYTRQLDAP